MAETYREKAERGAALLDRLMPTWYRAIDKETLKLSDCQNCVCGQIARNAGSRFFRIERRFRSWIDWSTTLKWMAKRLRIDEFDEFQEHGFYANTNAGYRILDKEWRRIIDERLAKADS